MAAITRDEMETTVVNNLGQDYVMIWSNVARDISKLEKHPRVEIINKGRHGQTRWVEARVPMGEWNPVSGVKRAESTNKRVWTDEERQAAAERLAKAREART